MNKKIMIFAFALMCDFVASAVTTTDIWKAIGSPSGVTVTSVDKWDADNTAYEGISSWAKSQIAGQQSTSSSFKVRVATDGYGSLTYAYRVSSEQSCDYLTVKLDGETKATYSGSAFGKDASITINSSGTHEIEFVYSKDWTTSSGLDAAWIGSVKYSKDLTLTIPATKTSIANGEYKNTAYTRIVFEKGSKLTSVGDNAFKGSLNLKSIEFPEGLTSIGDGAFDGCTSLTNIVFPTTLTSLGKIDVSSMTALSKTLGDGYWILGNWVIGYQGVCPPEIGEVDTVRGFAKEALKDNDYIEAFAPSTSVLSGISKSAFENCFALQYVLLPESLKSIGESAFCGCTLLDWIDIPGSCETIGQYAFKYCFSLEGVTFASGVKSIGYQAFYDDYMIEEVDLPATVEIVGDFAFSGDSSLIRIGLPETVRYGINKQTLRMICSNFAHIREVTIKDAGGELVNGLFDGCKELNAVRFLSAEAPTVADDGTTLFKDTPETLTVYVPYGSTGWVGLAGAKGLPQAWPRNGSCPIRRSIAYWDVPTYLVQFDSNGGTLGVQPTYQKPETAFDLPPEPKQSGYVFAGWWTSPIEGWQVTADTIFIEGVYTTLYAHWTRAHTIFLDAKGGTVTKTAIQIEQSVYGVLPAPVRTGYAFGGWSYQGETIVPHMNILTNADHTLTAQWKAFNYSVHFNANGGAGTMQAQEFKYDTLQSLSQCAFTRAGYSFSGWATSAKGTVVYTDCQKVKNLSALQGGIVNLYAVWTPSYTVILHRCCDNMTATVAFPVGQAKNLPYIDSQLKWTRQGYTFLGWGYDCTGLVKFANGASVKNLAAKGEVKHLYAVWGNQYSYTVVFHRNYPGSSDSTTANQRIWRGAPTRLAWKDSGLGWATPAGYSFDGWATSAKGAVVYANGKQVKNIALGGKTIHLYAKWTGNKYSVCYHYNYGTTDTTKSQAFTYGTMQRLMYVDSGLKWTHPLSAGFLGWAESSDGAVKYANGANVSNLTSVKDGIVHLYAKWALIKVRYNYNYTYKTAVQYFKKDVAQNLLYKDSQLKWSNPSGKTFVGWGTTKTATTAKYTNGQRVTNPAAVGTTLELYAIWTTKKTSAVRGGIASTSTSTSTASTPNTYTYTPGYYRGAFADGSGTFDLLLDEFDDDGIATAYLAIATADGNGSSECEAYCLNGVLVINAECGTFEVFVDDGAYCIKKYQ